MRRVRSETSPQMASRSLSRLQRSATVEIGQCCNTGHGRILLSAWAGCWMGCTPLVLGVLPKVHKAAYTTRQIALCRRPVNLSL